MRINLNIGQGTLIFEDTLTLSRHFVLKFSQILKNRVFSVICQWYYTIIKIESLYFLFKN
jgi:hypothetical protein